MQGIDKDKPDDKRIAFNSRVVGGWKGTHDAGPGEGEGNGV